MGVEERELAREMYKELKAHPEARIQKQASVHHEKIRHRAERDGDI